MYYYHNYDHNEKYFVEKDENGVKSVVTMFVPSSEAQAFEYAQLLNSRAIGVNEKYLVRDLAGLYRPCVCDTHAKALSIKHDMVYNCLVGVSSFEYETLYRERETTIQVYRFINRKGWVVC